ncbi:MAG: helix-turn-helix domain-containing protein [Leptospiraceae bacterium]|nr:helix-turn-helix domain-containing protein [Leptospiraceae bacterium]
MNQFIDTFSIFGISICILLLIRQFLALKKNTKNYLLTAILVCLLLISIFVNCLFNRSLDKYSFVYFLHTPFVFALGPILYFFSAKILDEKFELERKIIIIQLLPSLLMLLVYIYLQVIDRELLKVLIIDLYERKTQNYIYLFPLLGSLTVGAYAILSGYRIVFFFKESFYRKEFSVRMVFIIVCITLFQVTLTIVSVFKREEFFFRMISVTMTLILLFLYIVSIKYPEFMQELEIIIENEKYKKTVLGNLDKDSLLENLKHLMEVEKIFREDDLSLGILAERMKISNHQLSELLNNDLKQSFFGLVNYYRIEEAKKLLLDKKNDTVLSIAYSVGFNSKSSFNTAFLKLTSLSPTEYRKRFLKIK